MPRLVASDFIDSVFAVRQALSAPVWAKPTLIVFLGACAASGESRASVRTLAAVKKVRRDRRVFMRESEEAITGTVPP
jgi:hypothetical protein